MKRFALILFLGHSLGLAQTPATNFAPEGLRVATFDCDASPAPGSELAYDPMITVGELSLRARGIVLQGSGKPVVLCAVDWIGIANDGFSSFRSALAEAAGTDPSRVALHALHQHDSPICDFTTAAILRDFGQQQRSFDPEITRPVMKRVAEALKASLAKSTPVTHVGKGIAQVKEVASNRRILGSDGKVMSVRFTATKDPALRAEPEGVIDPECTVVSLWNGDTPIALLSSYATHPQSYYRTGLANPDFPGLARFLRGLAMPEALHVHFTGAGGNIGAGKYNDGAKENRLVLAQRLAEGLAAAWKASVKEPLSADQVTWKTQSVKMKCRNELQAEDLEKALMNKQSRFDSILGSAMQLAWLRRCEKGADLDITCLHLGSIRWLGLPGEAFVEYQLFAKKAAADKTVLVAGYGEYGPGYIGTSVAYAEGGYETQVSSSFVPPETETLLNQAIADLVK